MSDKFKIKYLTPEQIMGNMVARSQQKTSPSTVTYDAVYKLLEKCATLNYSAVDVLRFFEWEFNK